MRDWHSAEQGYLPEQGGRTAKILKERGTITEWQKNHGRKIIYDCGGSGSGIAGVKVKSLPDCAGTERRITETGLSDGGGTCERYIFSQKSLLQRLSGKEMI